MCLVSNLTSWWNDVDMQVFSTNAFFNNISAIMSWRSVCIGGGNQSARRKVPTCHKSFQMKNCFIDWCCYYTQVSYTGTWEPLVLFLRPCNFIFFFGICNMISVNSADYVLTWPFKKVRKKMLASVERTV
jgi:hypothetical protein